MLFGLRVSAFVRAPRVSNFLQRKPPPAQKSILLQHGGGLQGAPAEQSKGVAPDTDGAMRLDDAAAMKDEHVEGEGGSSEGVECQKAFRFCKMITLGCGCQSMSHLFPTGVLGVQRALLQRGASPCVLRTPGTYYAVLTVFYVVSVHS